MYAAGESYQAKSEVRPSQNLPAWIDEALEARELTSAYRERPPYQQRDYVAWVDGAKRDATRQRRLAQMLSELEEGGVYMKMPWGSQKTAS